MGIMGHNLTSSDGTTAQAGLGDTHWNGGTQYGYRKAGGAIAIYDLVAEDNTLAVCVAGTTTISGAKPSGFCIPQFAVASGEFFWAPIGPIAPVSWDNATTFKVNAAASCAADVKLYTTAAAGVIDDAASTTDLIDGLQLTETITTAAAAKCIAVGRLGSNTQD